MRETDSSLKTIGTVGMFPACDEAAGFVGSWTVTLPEAFGILIGFLHFGQGPVWPANLSLTLNRAWHEGQTTEIAMKGTCRKKVKENVLVESVLLFEVVF